MEAKWKIYDGKTTVSIIAWSHQISGEYLVFFDEKGEAILAFRKWDYYWNSEKADISFG